MQNPDWTVVAIVFWIFVIAVSVTPMVLNFLKRRETERTIRLAIEKGQTLEPEVLTRLLSPRPAAEDQTSPHNVRFGGIVTLSVAVGLTVFGLITGREAMFGLAALVGCVGLGLIVGSRFLPDPRQDSQGPQA